MILNKLVSTWPNSPILFLISGFILFSQNMGAQVNRSLCIIDNIDQLESTRDPKCHATANRLEDFMYGTPLSNDARVKKTELQKKLILYIWDAATKVAQNNDKDSIGTNELEYVFNKLSMFGRYTDGDWYVNSDDGPVRILPNDLRQYSSVAYALRAMLSVEQDLLFNPSWELLPLTDQATQNIKIYLDLVTLASLKIADRRSRNRNQKFIEPKLLEDSWKTVLTPSKEDVFLYQQYPEEKTIAAEDGDFVTTKSIVSQKIKSYKAYNEISLPIFLRNIQVYFARHKWPTDEQKSNELKNYLMESLVYFCQELINKSSLEAVQESYKFIRAQHVNSVVPLFLPFEINSFEDVIYFPGTDESVMIESYDLDAFRDSGLHWLILQYAIDDMDAKSMLEPDPFAAEILVESVAQMALLVLRRTGEISLENQHVHIMLEDMENAFKWIQEMILSYPEKLSTADENKNDKLLSSSESTKANRKVFYDISAQTGIDFMHKSSDWLSRLIRSYVVLEEENLVRMAVPPAFGGSGVAAEDINNDQWPDLILLGGMGAKVYLNNANGGFEDITKNSGINIWNGEKSSYSEPRQIIVADFDNDGWQDIFISLVDDQHKLYKNINGLSFKDVSNTAMLGGTGRVAGPATALDFDKDGLLDIYIGYFGNYIEGELPSLSRNNQNGSPNKLFKNMGGMRFEESEHVGKNDVDFGWTQAVGHTDINQDGWQDIIVGNDFGVNAYYINQKDGSFKNLNKKLKTDKPSYTMNVGSTDLNGDMFPDLYISNIVVMEKDEKYVNPTGDTKMNFELEKMENIRTVEANDLFLSNTNNGKLIDFIKSDQIGRGYSSTGWSWDADFFDFDNDGDEDLYCLNGMNDFRVYGVENPYYSSPEGEKRDVLFAHSRREKNNFFVNENGMLTDKAELLGADLLSNSRSAAYLDFDRDGDLDIVINNYHDKAYFLENRSENSNNWIAIRLEGDTESKITRDAIGANIIVKPDNTNKSIWREVHSTTGYLSVHPKIQHFGLGKASRVDVTIQWPDGTKQEFKALDVNGEYLISRKAGVVKIAR